jgi:hypothetical protein
LDGAYQDAHAWQCPRLGHATSKRADLPEAQRTALTVLQERTGADLHTCPHAVTEVPWVYEALRAHRWQRQHRGNLADITVVTTALVDAVDAIGAGVNAREQFEFDESRKQQ